MELEANATGKWAQWSSAQTLFANSTLEEHQRATSCTYLILSIALSDKNVFPAIMML